VTVHRLWTWQPTEADPGTLSRLGYYVTFAVHALLWLLVYGRRYDVVLTTTPPISTGLPGFVPSLTGAWWVVDVRDLWIDASVSLGFIEEGSLVERASRAFQRRVLETADIVTVTTETLRETLRDEFGADLTGRTVVVPNGVDMARFGTTPPDRNGETPRRGDDRPVLVYVGNIGHAQDLDVCVRAMEAVSADAVLRLVGGGDAVPSLKRLVRSRGLDDRVEFVEPVPREEIPGILARADVGLAPLVDDEELAYAMPTKVYEYLGSRLPVVVTGRGELKRFVEESGGGVHAPNDVDAVAAAIDDLLADDERRAEMAANGYEYVRSEYDREHIASRLDDHLRGLGTSEDRASGDEDPRLARSSDRR